MKWVLSIDDMYYRWFWTGEISNYGFPVKTRDHAEARKFSTAGEANDRAKTEPKLQNWRARKL